MKRRLVIGLLFLAAALSVAPSQARAYSYGDANTDDVAETFKVVMGELAKASPGWNAAEKAYKVRRSEIEAHFGKQVAVTLDNNFKSEDKSLVVTNFKALLVMNLDRRFRYAVEGIDDYAGTKILLAKAKATYDALEPYMTSGKDGINQSFDDALEALGNPGLFGVGKKDAQPDVLKEKTKSIYNAVKPLFPYKAYVKPAEPKATASASPKPTSKPITTPSPSPSSSKENEGDDATAEPSVSPTTEASASPSEEPSTEPSPSASSEAGASNDGSATASADVNGEGEVQQASAHAPMDRTDKTNSWVTYGLIGGVAIAGAIAVWFVRRKKWF